MDPATPSAPPVVAVMVAKDPGDWFTDTLTSLAAQDYPSLSVLVFDAGEGDVLAERVAAVLPEAYVRRLGADRGFGWAANHAIRLVEGAAFFVLCHDDVAFAPDAVRLLVEEAFRSNAGVVAPKVVEWDDPEKLLAVGMGVDKTGVPAPLMEPGELDQSQYDQVRDVFCAPGAATLVRADLFVALGGYDPDITYLGDDVDLCWRAHLAGARVVTAPQARVRHRQDLATRRPDLDQPRLAARHRLRTTLVCYSAFHLLRVIPQAFVLMLAQVVYALLIGRTHQARALASAWSWNVRRTGGVLRRRRAVRRLRQVRDPDIRRLQVRGFVALSAFVRGEGDEEERGGISAAGRSLAQAFGPGPVRWVLIGWVAVLLVVLVGSRHLLTRGLPALSGFAPFPDGPGPLLREFLSGWKTAGLGAERPNPTAFGLLGLGGIVTLGAMGVLQQVVITGMIPIGLLGAYRMPRALGSPRARVAALVIYAAVPLPYNALARGSWGGLVLYAAAPWVLGRLATASALDPWAPPARAASRFAGLRPALGLGVVVALAATVVPFVVVFVPLMAVGLVLGSLLVGGTGGALRALWLALAASVVGAVLNLPWALDFVLPGGVWSAFGGIPSAATAPDLGDLLRFQTGPLGAGLLGWAVLVVGLLPLVLGAEWRRAWAARAWGVALVAWLLAWAGAQGWIDLGLPAPDVLLAPAAAALALAAALGWTAFEHDLPGRRFGWRQPAVAIAGVAAAAAVVPVLVAAVDGSWDAPASSFDRSLAFLDEEPDAGGFRVLWVGDPSVLPLAGWELADGVAYATSDDGTPDVRDQWAGSLHLATERMADGLELAADGDTARLGRLLAPLGVRYVVVPNRAAPELTGLPLAPPPVGLLEGLASQLDLEQIPVDGALTVYRNLAAAPVRAVLPAGGAEAAASEDWTTAAAADLAPSTPALTRQDGPTSWSGEVAPGEVLVAQEISDRWRLRVAGADAPRADAFGEVNRFAVPQGGPGTLVFDTPPSRYALVALQVVLWALAVVVLVRTRPRPADGTPR